MAASVQTGINMLQVGLLRMPFLFAQMNAALLVGEVAFRAVKSGLEQLGFTGESPLAKKVSDLAPSGTVEVIRPYRTLSLQQIAVSAFACALIGNIGAATVSAVFGNPPPIYNRVLGFLGNIRITNEIHPAVAFSKARLGY